MHVIITGRARNCAIIMAASVQLAQSFHWAYQLSCSTDRTIKFLRSLLWPICSLKAARASVAAVKVSTSRHAITRSTKLRMKNFWLNEKQDNIEFYLSCKFQPSTFNVRCKTDVIDGMPDKQTNERTTVCRGSAPRHNNTNKNRPEKRWRSSLVDIASLLAWQPVCSLASSAHASLLSPRPHMRCG